MTAWGMLYAPVVVVLAGARGAPIAVEVRVVVEILGALAIVLAAWLMVRFIDRRPFASFGFGSRHLIRDLLVGLASGSAMIGLAMVISGLAGWVQLHSVDTYSWYRLAAMGVAMLANSTTQEVLFRGYVLQTVEAHSDTLTAVIVSSLLFVGAHAGALAEGGVLPGVNLFAAGILLGLAYTATRNLWLPTALHFAWNFLQGPVLGIAVSGQSLDSGWRLVSLDGPRMLTGGDFGLEGGLLATLVTVLAVFGIVVLARGWSRSS